ncbi:MAG: exosortase-associated protein EpsI, V-type [Sphingomicrobium sp.]
MKLVVGSFMAPEIDRRKLLVGLLFCSAAGLAAWRKPNRHLDYLGSAKLDNIVPKEIGRWKFVAASGLVVPPEDQMERAIYSQLLTRVYSDGQNEPVMLLLAQSGSETGILQIHRPETCYTASGYHISGVTSRTVEIGSHVVPANAMDATSDGVTEHVLYWTRVGNKMPANWGEQRIATAEQNLEGILPDAILVRISTVSNDPARAWASLDAFTRAFIQSVPPGRRNVFIA